MKLEDIPEIEEGECIHVNICYNTGASLQTKRYYLLNRDNVGTPETPAIRVFDPKISGQYLEPETIQLKDIISFGILEFSK